MNVPRATYRLQLGPGFRLDDASALAGYLAELGVSHVYLSPYLQAASGSVHGYDVVDPTRVSEALGGEDAHRRLSIELARHGLGQVLDIVPNHMAISPLNRLWWDVLRSGPSSAFAHFFDVDWDPPEPRLRNRILLPLLEDHYGRVLERGLLRLKIHRGEVQLCYHDHLFPLAPRSLPLLLGPAAEIAGSAALARVSRAYSALPEPGLEDARGREALLRETHALDAELCRSLTGEVAMAAAVEAVVRRTESNADALDELLEGQWYRLAFWRAGIHEMDYRRFFDVDTLVALRVEDDEVFRHAHGRVLSWLAEGVLEGVRIDHVDGLRDPLGYLARVRAHAPSAWIVVEKVLAPDEVLPDAWPVEGTTGYDFLNDVAALFVDASAEPPLAALYQDLTGDERPWRDVATEARRRALRELLSPDLERLTQLFVRICEGRRRFRDHTRNELRDVLRETAAHHPVYRTYVDGGGPSRADVEHVESALAGAARDRPDLDAELMGLVGRILLGREEGTGALEAELRLRFQQLTGAVAAKALEDAAFYSWPRFVALNEVGGDPARFGLTPSGLHARNARRQARWPHGMSALSTHDTKRGEDVRARLIALTEVPEAWAAEVRRWAHANERHRRGSIWPDRGAEYLFYQTLVGAWPLPRERALAYMEKASREARVHTSWLAPDAEYEERLAAFVSGAFNDDRFRRRVRRFVATIEEAGWSNAVAQKLVQLTAPGVPDLYQGTELADASLVDPDNRRPVDFEIRRRLLAELRAGADARAIWRRREEGLPKLWIVAQALRVRAERPEAFGAAGAYTPLHAEGAAAEHVFAFVRGNAAITVVPRLTLRLARAGGWRSTKLVLPRGRWENRLTGAEAGSGPVSLEELLGEFPVALLVRG